MPKTTAVDIASYFAPIIGQKPWRVRLGFGSFLTFDFGSRVKDVDRYFGAWHLWIQHCDWQLQLNGRAVVTSESERRLIELAVRNLQDLQLESVRFDDATFRTEFQFGNTCLICTAYPDEEPDDEHWELFMPDHRVLSVGPTGKVMIGSADKPRN